MTVGLEGRCSIQLSYVGKWVPPYHNAARGYAYSLTLEITGRDEGGHHFRLWFSSVGSACSEETSMSVQTTWFFMTSWGPSWTSGLSISSSV